jgi:hypothetical protein
MRTKIAAVLAVLATVLIPLFATVSPANAAPAGVHHMTHAQRIANSWRMAHRLGDSFYIRTDNGQHLGVGCVFCSAGNPVIQKAQAGWEVMVEHFVTTDPEGFPEYRITYANYGTYMAATAGCAWATQRSDPTSNGVVWIYYTAPNDNFYLVPRYCVPDHEYDIQLGSDNVVGHQWRVTADVNMYRAVSLIAP